ncbi:universal stress protein [Methylocapsa acidiphila]|uniref:universal stress protein n=1 Tax=Methylocapsa acidiphila TaxID=133552 RepID=UPI00047D51AB|nr:universal stress protein [Methylocapsa acidiphila]
MSYATFLVHLDLDQTNEARLKIVADLAQRFDASVIGVAACAQTMPLYFTDGMVAEELVVQDRSDLEQRLRETEQQFRAGLAGRVNQIEWRSALTQPTSFVAEQSRAADLVVIGGRASGDPIDSLRQLIPSDVVTFVGRPVLVVPQNVETLAAKRVLIAWKDAREARRAVFDALPLLLKCEKAIVAEIDESGEPDAARARVEDVAAWLGRHGVTASCLVQNAIAKTSDELNALARQEEADLIVAGAYGHSRVREWILGGVTRDLLTRTPRCALLSH